MSCYTLFIGTKNWSSWSLRAWLALRATGAQFEEVVIRLRQADTSATIRRLTGCDTVPALRIDENGASQTVFDSLAICETLAERHPESKLWPTHPADRATARSISAAMHSGFGALRSALPMEFARSLPMPQLSADASGQIATIMRFWCDALSAHGGDFLFGRFSIADCMYAPVASRFRTYGIALEPALQAYCDCVFGLGAMRDWLKSSEIEVSKGLP
jgi:glutathione S-transferase